MGKYSRLLIHDKNGIKYRICNFQTATDKFNEKYLKISFPDLKKKLSFFEKVEGKKAYEVIPLKEQIQIRDGVVEYSFHYHGNASHFKFGGIRELQRKNTPSLDKHNAIHIITVFIYDLHHFVPFNKRVNENDFEIQKSFDNARILQFFASKNKIHLGRDSFDTDETKFVEGYVFTSNDDDIKITIFDEEFKNNPKSKNGIDLYRMHNPLNAIVQQSNK